MRILFLTAGCLVLFHLSSAQKIELGIKSGINFSKLDHMGDKLLPGINAGVYASIEVKGVKIQPEIVYSQQGVSDKITFTSPSGSPSGTVDLITNLNYLNVPILVKARLASGLNFLVGPQAGFILTAKSHAQPYVASLNGDMTKSANTDFSVVMGLSCEFTSGISFGARYNHGVNQVGGFFSANRVIQISIGYRLFKFSD